VRRCSGGMDFDQVANRDNVVAQRVVVCTERPKSAQDAVGFIERPP
jgi:hypothetical protein